MNVNHLRLRAFTAFARCEGVIRVYTQAVTERPGVRTAKEVVEDYLDPGEDVKTWARCIDEMSDEDVRALTVLMYAGRDWLEGSDYDFAATEASVRNLAIDACARALRKGPVYAYLVAAQAAEEGASRPRHWTDLMPKVAG